jgi:glycosyltransferase involved in cell wall biosynthesis/nucleotide-binding universal stress UspA family protein
MRNKYYPKTVFRKVVVPVVHSAEMSAALDAARAVAGDGQVILVGMVCMPEDQSLSAAAVKVREVRQFLKNFTDQPGVHIEEQVHVTHHPWDELVNWVRQVNPDLLLLDWPRSFDELNITPEALDHPPCDVAIQGGVFPELPQNILVSIRGGPYAELALRLSLAVARSRKARVTSLHISPANHSGRQDIPYRNINRILVRLPEVNRKELLTDDPASSIRETARDFDLVVMGAPAHFDSRSGPLGPLALSILNETGANVIVVKTKRPLPASFESEMVGQSAISVLVDKWFAENTYHADEFSDLEALARLKQNLGVTISLALPALNEEETVGTVITTIKQALMDAVPLVDEIVLVDSNSTDRTREIAAEAGIPVYIHQETLPQYGPRRGKGEALWKSLHLTRGDIVLWIDTDIVNIQPHFVAGLIGPFLLRPEVQFVKGFYQRPLRVGDKLQAGSGGRVTELAARPLINLLYPELSGVIHPLAGEYGGRRAALERLPFSSGYGVEIGLLIDILDNFGLSAIAQVDLQERIHHNQPLEALSKMSFTIIQTVFRKLGKRYNMNFLEDMNRTMKMIRYEPGKFSLDVEELAEQERPPMIEIPEYRQRSRP